MERISSFFSSFQRAMKSSFPFSSIKAEIALIILADIVVVGKLLL
jgi:hypothetical protein